MNDDKPRKRIRNGQFSLADMEIIAGAVASGLTETEAVLRLNKEPKTWFIFKNRVKNSPKYLKILTRIRGDYIAANLAEIKKAATGTGGVRHDWRAADRMNGIIAPERFGQSSASQTVTTLTALTINCGGEDQLRRLIEAAANDVKRLNEGQRVFNTIGETAGNCQANNDAQCCMVLNDKVIEDKVIETTGKD